MTGCHVSAARHNWQLTKGAEGHDNGGKFFCLLFFKDKFVWNEFEQPEAGAKGKLQGCSL